MSQNRREFSLARANIVRETTSPSRPSTKVRSVSCKKGTNCMSVLSLKQSRTKFNPPSKKESIFFDECNREIISLTLVSDEADRNKTRVVFQPVEEPRRIELLLPVEKRILSIKFNSNRSVIAYHVERNLIEFINVRNKLPESNPSTSVESSPQIENSNYVLEERKYVQSCRAKNSKLIGFLWTDPSGVVFITDLSVEYYHVDQTRRRLSLIRFFQSATNWFVYQPPVTNLSAGDTGFEQSIDASNASSGSSPLAESSPYSLLIVSTGSLGNSMQPYMFSDGQVSRLQRFEVEGDWQGSDKLELFERSITIGYIYSSVHLLVLQHESLNLRSKGAQIILYTIDPESGCTTQTHTLDLDTSGRFAINICDNLVIAHDQPSKSSFIFDIGIESTEKSDCPNHFVSLIGSRPMKELELREPRGGRRYAEMYSFNWVFFQPNFIVDAKLGLLCTLQLDLGEMFKVLDDKILLLNFLALRRNSRDYVLKLCKELIDEAFDRFSCSQTSENRLGNSLGDISAAFEIVGHLVNSAAELSPGPKKQLANNEKAQVKTKLRAGTIVDQVDFEREIFRKLSNSIDSETTPAQYHFITSVLFEFIFAVRFSGEKNVEFCIYEHLVNCLVKGNRFFQIIQLIRNDILRDSKQLACLLISIQAMYEPAGQLGLDMLDRLNCGSLPASTPA